MDTLQNFTFWGNTLLAWLTAVGIAVVAHAVFSLAIRIVRGRFAKLARETALVWDDLVVEVLGGTKRFTLLVASVYIGSQTLTLSDRAVRTMGSAMAVVLLLQIGVWGTAVVRSFLQRYTDQRKEDGAAITSMKALIFVIRLVLWSVVALLVLDNLGVDITALVAGLGVGGIAVALAVQNVLGDLFASLSIVLDKPFVNGDFIAIGDLVGNVEHVGLKTTRVRSLSGEQLVFSNADLLSSRIKNFGRMNERRIAFSIGVTYDTPRETLRQIPEMIKRAVESEDEARFDRSHFKEFGDSALMFETVYYVLVPDYAKYMDVQQAINLSIHEQFEASRIEFAFPTQTLHIVSDAAQAG
jgi:small-conductance mechanosensitive channel